jgi:hypothetical protein
MVYAMPILLHHFFWFRNLTVVEHRKGLELLLSWYTPDICR